MRSRLALLACVFFGFAVLSKAAYGSYFGVVKGAQFEQSAKTAPTLLASNAYLFTAFVMPATNYAVTNAAFKAPNVSTNRVLSLSTDGELLQFLEVFQTSTALDAAYPSSMTLFSPSVYQFKLGAVHDGPRTGKASYMLGGTPPIPQLKNLSEAQSIDTTADLTVHWAAMGGAVGIVQLLVLDAASNVVYSSPVPFSAGALTHSSTLATIPANTLPAGTNLTGHLAFAVPGLPDNSSYPGAIGVAALAKDTSFPLLTRASPVRPRLRIIPSGSGPALVQFIGETNRHYHLQRTTNLIETRWVDLLVTNAPTVSFVDTQSVNLPRSYYRYR